MTDPTPAPTAPLTDHEMELYVREHRCYAARGDVSLADWDRGVAAIERQAIARHREQADAEVARLKAALGVARDFASAVAEVIDDTRLLLDAIQLEEAISAALATRPPTPSPEQGA